MKTRKTDISLGFKLAKFTLPRIPPTSVYYGFYRFGRTIHQFKGSCEYDLYLSGAMTGVESHNYPKFHRYARNLRREGFRVFNPAENFGGDTSLDRETYMRHDVKAVARSEAIFILPDYEESEGVATELNTALGLRMPIFIASESKDAQLPLISKYNEYEH